MIGEISNYEKFEDLPTEVQDDLIKWYNSSKPTDDEKENLKLMYNAGLFESWDCPECGSRCLMSITSDINMLQGALQPDMLSYPGNDEKYTQEYNLKLCDHCRSKF